MSFTITAQNPTIVVRIGSSYLARDVRGEILEATELGMNGQPGWPAATICDARGAGDAEGFGALVRAFDELAKNAKSIGIEEVRLGQPYDYSTGDRVRLRRRVDRFPHFSAPAGATGTITEIIHAVNPGDYDMELTVKLDAELDGAGPWDNSVQWYGPDDVAQLPEDVEVIA